MIGLTTRSGAQHTGEIPREIKLCDILNSGSQESPRTYFKSIAEVLWVGRLHVAEALYDIFDDWMWCATRSRDSERN